MVPKPPACSETSWYQWNSHNLVCGTGKHKQYLKEINRIWKTYKLVAIIPKILENQTFFLLYSKVSSHTTWAITLPYHSNSYTLVLPTKKMLGVLERNRMWKNTYVAIKPAILGIRIFFLLYSKIQNHQAWSATPEYHSNSHNLLSRSGKNWLNLTKIIRIWKIYNIKNSRNSSYILLHLNMSKYPTQSEAHWSQSNITKLGSKTEKRLKSMKIIKLLRLASKD